MFLLMISEKKNPLHFSVVSYICKVALYRCHYEPGVQSFATNVQLFSTPFYTSYQWSISCPEDFFLPETTFTLMESMLSDILEWKLPTRSFTDLQDKVEVEE
ncbi:hypothetical protein ATANTOWER_004491 [Ataeniobius toweri]|uniref:Uncharacterized protein n=1 Tax=Ataeniobius toweri TaxID=208326 RepID=A0ABU7AMI1_9TELE|nr:hypothetical protein [Ataeniobius toweri]